MTTYDIHAHCIPAALLELLRDEGPRLGIELADDGKGEYAVIGAGSAWPPSTRC